MAAFTGNPELLIASLVRDARTGREIADAIAYLAAKLSIAWLGGDEYATNISTEGSATSWLREIPANLAAQLLEAAMQKLEQIQATGGSGTGPGDIRFADFSQHVSNQG